MASKTKAREEPEHPKEPPEYKRRILLRPATAIGVVLIALLPALALAGLFGETEETLSATGPGMVVDVLLPIRTRYRVSGRMVVTVRSTGDAPLRDLEVTFDRAYLDAFQKISINPPPRNAYVVRFDDVEAGGTRRVVVEHEADEPGPHSGSVQVRHAGGEAVVQIRTFIFP